MRVSFQSGALRVKLKTEHWLVLSFGRNFEITRIKEATFKIIYFKPIRGKTHFSLLQETMSFK